MATEIVAAFSFVSKLLRLHSHSLGTNSFCVARNSQTYAPATNSVINVPPRSLCQFDKSMLALSQKFKNISHLVVLAPKSAGDIFNNSGHGQRKNETKLQKYS